MTYGQSNGYGNQQTGEFDAAIQRLDNTKPVGPARDPFIGPLEHALVVLALEPYRTEKDGPCARVTFEVLESKTHTPGSRVCKLWKLAKPSMWPNQATDADHFAEFVRKISGQGEGVQVGRQCAALIRDRVQENLLRGMVVRAYGTENAKKNYVNVAWISVAQTQDDIRARRAQLDAKSSNAPMPQTPPQNPATPAAYGAAPQATQPPTQPQWSNAAPLTAQPPAQPQWSNQAPQAAFGAPPSYPATQTPATAPASGAPGPLLSQIPGFDR